MSANPVAEAPCTPPLEVPTPNRIREVHLVFKTHLDVGFTDFAAHVKRNYFQQYIPAAIRVARTLKETGGRQRLIWTLGSWLVYEYLEETSGAERALLEQAILDGDIAWHGLPFTTHSELMDADLFRFGLSLARRLDARFGKRTIAAKMTDVPGHTRAIVPLLAEAGIQFLHIGVNPASHPPDVPPVFRWRDPSGAETIVMYHKGSYGEGMVVPGMDSAIFFAHTGDNFGPQSPEQVIQVHEAVRERFAGADVHASTLDAFASQLLEVRDGLPVVEAEIGDTWIHGVGSDPVKVSRFRELCRLRRAWMQNGTGDVLGEPLDRFNRCLLTIAEHTWGMDEKTHLGDYRHYAAEDFKAARQRPEFVRFEASWAEQRAYVDQAIEALGETEAGREARARMAAIAPAWPNRDRMRPLDPGAGEIDAGRFSIGFDPACGAIRHLADRVTGRVWAGPEHPLALFTYELFSQRDYDRFWRQYVIQKKIVRPWAWPDLTKPGIQAFAHEHREGTARLAGLYHEATDAGHRFLLELEPEAEALASDYGCPRVMTLEVFAPRAGAELRLDFQWFDKPACRLPEALWLSFRPRVKRSEGWRMEKMGEWIAPREVLRNGNRRLHAVGAGLRCPDGTGALEIETLDAPLVAPGERSLLNFTNQPAPLAGGMHVNLCNNIWGTNFPMWCEADARFRFILRFP